MILCLFWKLLNLYFFPAVKQRKSPVHWTWILSSEQSIVCFPRNPQHDVLMLTARFPFLEGFGYYCENFNASFGLNGISASPRSCLRSIMARDLLSQRTKEKIQASMNSVHLLAHAYETASQTGAGQLDRAVFARSLGNVHHVLYSDEWKVFSNQRRMKRNMFSLIQARMNNSKSSLVNVGTWDSVWYINDHGIKWESDERPRSSCGVPCPPGYIRVVKGDCKCCWSCLACHYNQIVTDEYTCTDCLRGYWPNKDFTKCEFQWRRALFDCTLAIVAVVFVFSFMVLWKIPNWCLASCLINLLLGFLLLPVLAGCIVHIFVNPLKNGDTQINCCFASLINLYLWVRMNGHNPSSLVSNPKWRLRDEGVYGTFL